VVIAGTGLGHVHQDIIPAIQDITATNIPVVMTSQCLWGRVNMRVYSVGRKLLQIGVISGEDMLPETALVKLMWALANSDDVASVMKSNLAGEITSRVLFNTFPKQKKYM
jgi:glutamyl-tRNA(Gln) amidotransferase subunit D